MKFSKTLKKGFQFTQLGLTMVVITGLFIGGGYYADQYFNTGNTLTVTGIIVGTVMGLLYFVLEIYRLTTEGLEDDRTDDSSDEGKP